ncbi:hypothetical protein [Caulobacter sp. Root655]|nr:hypothetical protein [Caulobacter sp. Root655]
MRRKLMNAPLQWWRNYPELSLATGWALFFGALWSAARVFGLA